jgi:hypothetical protein
MMMHQSKLSLNSVLEFRDIIAPNFAQNMQFQWALGSVCHNDIDPKTPNEKGQLLLACAGSYERQNHGDPVKSDPITVWFYSQPIQPNNTWRKFEAADFQVFDLTTSSQVCKEFLLGVSVHLLKLKVLQTLTEYF